jgi:hypothetical protein
MVSTAATGKGGYLAGARHRDQVLHQQRAEQLQHVGLGGRRGGAAQRREPRRQQLRARPLLQRRLPVPPLQRAIRCRQCSRQPAVGMHQSLA